MQLTVQENIAYKSRDHLFRGQDEYANAKYDITTDWLKPSIGLLGQVRTLANIGCGSGEYNKHIASLGVAVTACEPEQVAFDLAKSGCQDFPLILVKKMGLEEFTLKTPPVDFLVMHDVLEHIENEAEAVQCVVKLLNRGGEAVISVPAYQWLFGFHDEQLGHYRRYTRKRLIQIFEPHFEILHSRYFGFFFIPITFVFSKCLRIGYATHLLTTSKWSNRLLRLVCQFQRFLPFPAGTSVLIHLKRR